MSILADQPRVDSPTPEEVRGRFLTERSWTSRDLLPLVKFLHERAATDAHETWSEVEHLLFGDPTQYIDDDPDQGPGMDASASDGPVIDLLRFAGLELDDDASDRLWGERNWDDIIHEADGEILRLEEFDGGPGSSDTFYRIVIDDAEEFARRLREVMIRLLTD